MTIAQRMTARQWQRRAPKGWQEGVALECSAAGHWHRGMVSALVAAGLSAIVLSGFTEEAWGQEEFVDDGYYRVFTTYRAASVIDGHSLRGVQGAINVNMAAGSSNLQSNSGVIAMGEQALANNIVVQVVTSNNRLAPEQATAVIKDQALSQSVGWISVNQAAGQENVQSNTLSVALGIRGSSLNSESLSQVQSRTQESTEESDDGTSSRRVAIEDSAFAGSRGVIQVNQSAGKGNATGNHVGVRMTSGARR
ncbi:hypothetical protein [Billgrantia gudaonensis]|uniref:Uncharacterized protein n=1 Tax=Billgrantia gudaonensis TaxID=376427 RepID=A0A1G8PG35_9GAMM|nr:hypothetical protein [Halomonas gudaonensis]SDI91439.1 hypothetical protein SAMN04487954_10273 [Halomonas gudaonensis]